MVQNLKNSLLKADPSSKGLAGKQNGTTRHKRTKVGVLISGTGERPVQLLTVERVGTGGVTVKTCFCGHHRHQPAGTDRPGQVSVQLCRDCGCHLQQAWSSGSEEGISGWYPVTGKCEGPRSLISFSM